MTRKVFFFCLVVIWAVVEGGSPTDPKCASWTCSNPLEHLKSTTTCNTGTCSDAVCCEATCLSSSYNCAADKRKPLVGNPVCSNGGCRASDCCDAPTCGLATTINCGTLRHREDDSKQCNTNGCNFADCCKAPSCDLANGGQAYQCPATRAAKAVTSTCNKEPCEVTECCEDPTCALANDGSYYLCPARWVREGTDHKCTGNDGCPAGQSDKLCCDLCTAINVKEGQGSNPINGRYMHVGTLNGKPYYRQPGQGTKKQLFIYSAPARALGTPKWYLGSTLGSTTVGVLNYLNKDIDLPLTASWSGGFDTWSILTTMELECKGNQDEETCLTAENGEDLYACKGNGNFLKSISEADDEKCNGHGNCDDNKCCEPCGKGMFVTLKADNSLNHRLTGLYDMQVQPIIVNGHWRYSRQDGKAEIYFNDATQQWCIKSIGLTPPVEICEESDEDGPHHVSGWIFKVECTNDVPVRHPEDCDGRWKDVGKCTVPCMLDGVTPGEQLQQFFVEAPARWRGKACQELDRTYRTIPCHARLCPLDCIGVWQPTVVDEETKTAVCSKSCGWGSVSMKYKILKPATGKGHLCDHKDGKIITKPCFAGKCPITSSSSQAAPQP